MGGQSEELAKFLSAIAEGFMKSLSAVAEEFSKWENAPTADVAEERMLRRPMRESPDARRQKD